MNVADIQAQLVASRALLTATNAALLALADITVQSYTMDTGQGTQTVRRHELPELIKSQSSLMNQIATLEVRIRGRGTLHGVPDF